MAVRLYKLQVVVRSELVLVQVVPHKTQRCPLHMNTSRTKRQANGNLELLQTYPVFAADELLEIGTAINSEVLSLDVRLSHTQTLPGFRNSVTSLCIDISFATFWSRYALLNASLTAANYFDAK
jgi:hypothetical protein